MSKSFDKGGQIIGGANEGEMIQFGRSMSGHNTSEGLECWGCRTVFTDPDIAKRHQAFCQHICPQEAP